jgi:hypothetical protein
MLLYTMVLNIIQKNLMVLHLYSTGEDPDLFIFASTSNTELFREKGE